MQHINSFNKGMVRGIDYTIIPQNSYLYMLNGCLISRDDKGFVVTAIKGTKSIAEFNQNEVPIGSVSFNGILYIITHIIIGPDAFINVWSYKGSDGEKWIDYIAIIPNGPENKLSIPVSLLGFSRDKLLQVFAKESFDGSIDLYICDGLNPNAVINTGLDRKGAKTERTYESFTNKVQFLLHKSITKVPDITTSIKNVGNLKPGTYYFYLRYEDDTLNNTPFIKEVGPVFIHLGSTEADNIAGLENNGDNRVSKSIVLDIFNADPLYNRVSIAVVYYYGVDGILSRENFLIDKSYQLKSNSCNIVFSGDNPIRSIVVEEIISDNIQYNVSESHLQHENRYYGANWKGGNVDYNHLKEMAKRIIPRAVLNPEDNFDGVCDENTKEFEYMENEIYPFGVSFLIDGRYKTPVFPVCGWFESYKSPITMLFVPELPTVETLNPLAVNVYSADVGSRASSIDGIAILERGVCWKQGSNPPTYTDSKTLNGTGTGIYNSLMINLLKETLYSYRSYIKTIDGIIIYGQVKTVRTVLPQTFTNEAFDITINEATVTYNVTTRPDCNILDKGVLWSTYSNPDMTIYDDFVSEGPNPGNGEVTITGLEANTTYFYRSYAEIEVSSYVYSTVRSLKTVSGNVILTTASLQGINATSIDVAGGNITDDGGSHITARGVCWSTSPNPDLTNNNKDAYEGPGAFIVNVEGLIHNTFYYLRAFAENGVGIHYGNEITFTTRNGIATLITDTPVFITAFSAMSGGNVIDSGGADILEKGICYGTVNNPTIFDDITLDGSGLGAFTSVMQLLQPGTLHYCRAYAKNSVRVTYGNQVTHMTPAGEIVLVTHRPYPITDVSAFNSGANLSNHSGTPIIAKGLCWNTGTSRLPTIEGLDEFTIDGNGSDSWFGVDIHNLIPNSTYYLRSYAMTSSGTTYGTLIQFDTLDNV